MRTRGPHSGTAATTGNQGRADTGSPTVRHSGDSDARHSVMQDEWRGGGGNANEEGRGTTRKLLLPRVEEQLNGGANDI